MTEREIERIIIGVLNKFDERPAYKPPRMEFSKKLLIGILLFSGAFCILSIIFWYFIGDWPREIAVFFIAPFIAIASYYVKAGIENKAKIEKG